MMLISLGQNLTALIQKFYSLLHSAAYSLKKYIKAYYETGEKLAHLKCNTECSVPRMNDWMVPSL
jgi:hypothetical protein